MAKETKIPEESKGQRQSRQSRKEELRAKKQDEQLRVIRIGAFIVAGILALILLVAVVNEYVLSPQREVATLGSEKITLREFQDRVRLERAQRVITLEEQLGLLNNDVGMVQQFSGQTINELQSQNNEIFGEVVLNQMARDKLVGQALAERNITISDEEIEQQIRESYNYFNGQSPPVPTVEPTTAPTPSVTPIGATGEAPAVDVATPEPFPTATPVSEEAFRQEYGDFIKRYTDYGISEDSYRETVASSLAAERLLDVLADEQELPTEDLHASAFLLIYASEERARAALDEIADSDYLTVWNTVQSMPVDQAQDPEAPVASEILWETLDSATARLGPDLAAAFFNTEIGQPSDVVVVDGGGGGDPAYVVAMVSGREMRPLAEAALRERKVQLLSSFLDEAMVDVEIGEFWRSRVPGVPILNPKFLQPPTPTPDLPDKDADPTAE